MPYLEDKKNEKSLKSIIEQVIDSDYKQIKSSGQFIFDWKEERKNEVYKIYLLGQKEEILGVMSLIDEPDEYRIHLNLIEIQSKNQGKNKKIDRIAGCLIAFACELSFARGYYGFVSLQPKTRLINLYQNKYGFRQYGRLLGVEQDSSNFLIQKYLNNEDE